MQVIPREYCVTYLHNHDNIVVLVDENDDEYRMSYTVNTCALSEGWRSFSTTHTLFARDVLICQMVGPCMFKVVFLMVVSIYC